MTLSFHSGVDHLGTGEPRGPDLRVQRGLETGGGDERGGRGLDGDGQGESRLEGVEGNDKPLNPLKGRETDRRNKCSLFSFIEGVSHQSF